MNPVALSLLALGLGGYLLAVRRLRARAHGWSPWRVTSMVVGVALLALALVPPPPPVADHDLRVHVARHLLLGMLAPLGIVLAAPVTLLLRTLPTARARTVSAMLRCRSVHRLAHPATALLLDVGALYALYLTPLYAVTLSEPLVAMAVDVHFVLAGTLFAWSVVGLDPAPRRPGTPVRLAVVGLAIAAHATLAKLLYAHGLPHGTPHALEEVRAAARLMYYGGDVAELLLLSALFATTRRAPRRRGAERKRPGSEDAGRSRAGRRCPS